MKNNKKPQYIATVPPMRISHGAKKLPSTPANSSHHEQQAVCNSDTGAYNSEEKNRDKPSLETLQLSLLFLMSKFALTQDNSYAEAAYQHLHMLAVRCDTDSKPRFVYRSLAMDWVQLCRGQATTDIKSGAVAH